MGRFQRFVELVRFYLASEGHAGEGERLCCLDCLLAAPEAALPARQEMARVAVQAIEYYQGHGEPEDFRLTFSRLARHIDRWKRKWQSC